MLQKLKGRLQNLRLWTLCVAVVVPLFVLFSLPDYWPMAVVLAVRVLPLCLLHGCKTLNAMHEDGNTYKGIRAFCSRLGLSSARRRSTLSPPSDLAATLIGSPKSIWVY